MIAAHCSPDMQGVDQPPFPPVDGAHHRTQAIRFATIPPPPTPATTTTTAPAPSPSLDHGGRRYGDPGDVVILGDWTCDGVPTPPCFDQKPVRLPSSLRGQHPPHIPRSSCRGCRKLRARQPPLPKCPGAHHRRIPNHQPPGRHRAPLSFRHLRRRDRHRRRCNPLCRRRTAVGSDVVPGVVGLGRHESPSSTCLRSPASPTWRSSPRSSPWPTSSG